MVNPVPVLDAWSRTGERSVVLLDNDGPIVVVTVHRAGDDDGVTAMMPMAPRAMAVVIERVLAAMPVVKTVTFVVVYDGGAMVMPVMC